MANTARVAELMLTKLEINTVLGKIESFCSKPCVGQVEHPFSSVVALILSESMRRTQSTGGSPITTQPFLNTSSRKAITLCHLAKCFIPVTLH